MVNVISKANLTVPGTMTSWAPRLGNRTSNCWFSDIVLGLLVMTTDCLSPLTSIGVRRRRYGLRLCPKRLDVIAVMKARRRVQYGWMTLSSIIPTSERRGRPMTWTTKKLLASRFQLRLRLEPSPILQVTRLYNKSSCRRRRRLL